MVRRARVPPPSGGSPGGGGHIGLRGPGVDLDYPLGEARVSERLGAAPRLIHFADGSHLETTDHAAAEAALAAAGVHDGWVARVQGHWRGAMAAVVLSAAAIFAGYVYGLPWFAEQVALHVPPGLEGAIGRQSVKILDARLFEPSTLPQERQEALMRRFAELAPKDGRSYRIEFRASHVGPNALALPGGVILMTDELVELAADDEEVLAVLAHELGHIERRHLLRQLVTSTVTGTAATLIAGEASGMLTALPATLADLSYSRDMEREADAFAVVLLRARGWRPEALADMLGRLEAEHGGRPSDAASASADWTDYVSTHPPTAERVEAIRRAR